MLSDTTEKKTLENNRERTENGRKNTHSIDFLKRLCYNVGGYALVFN